HKSFSYDTAATCRASSSMALCPFPGSRPACAATPLTLSEYSPTPLRAVFTARLAPGSSTSTASDSRARASVIFREDLLPTSSSDTRNTVVARRFNLDELPDGLDHLRLFRFEVAQALTPVSSRCSSHGRF